MRNFQSISYFLSTILFFMGQVEIWTNSDKAVPFLLSAIFMILQALYFQRYERF